MADTGFVRKHAINFPGEKIALALGLALLLFVREPCPLGLRDGFLNKAGVSFSKKQIFSRQLKLPNLSLVPPNLFGFKQTKLTFENQNISLPASGISFPSALKFAYGETKLSAPTGYFLKQVWFA